MMKQFIICCFSLILGLSYCPQGHAQADPVSRSWNQPINPYRVIGNIYYVGAADVTSFLIVTPAGHILLDSGFVETVPQIRRNVAALGFRLEDVKILINSHAHYDHAGGFAQLKKLTGAKLMASEPDAQLLRNGGTGDFHFGERFSYAPVLADRILCDGDVVELGGVTMIAHLTPGHTKGCTTWTMIVTEGRKRYDVLFAGSSTVPGYNLVHNQQYPNIVADYERTFGVLKRLHCDVFLASHGSFYSMLAKLELLKRGAKRNPFIDPQGYQSFVMNSENAFREELKRQKR